MKHNYKCESPMATVTFLELAQVQHNATHSSMSATLFASLQAFGEPLQAGSLQSGSGDSTMHRAAIDAQTSGHPRYVPLA